MTTQVVTLRIDGHNADQLKKTEESRRSVRGLGDESVAAGGRAEQGFGRAARGADAAGASTSRARQLVLGFTAAVLSMQAINVGTRIVDTYAGITAQIDLATASQREAAIAQQEVYDIAQRTSTALTSTSDLYTRITRSTAEFGLEQFRLLKITETINQTFAVSGASAVAQSNAITQLTQAFAGGVLRAEEYNSVIEASPRLAQALADGLGVSIGELRKQVNDGTVSVARMIGALEGQAGAIEAEFARMPLTIERGWTQITTSVLRYVGTADQASGASRAIASSLSVLASNIDTLAGAGVALAVIMTGRVVGGMAAAALSTVASMRVTEAHTQALVLQSQMELRETRAAEANALAQRAVALSMYDRIRASEALTLAQGARIAAEGRAAAATAAASVGARAAATGLGVLRGAMGLLGGPVGVAITAFTGLYFWLNSTKDAADNLAGIQPTVRSIRELADEAERVRRGGTIISADERASIDQAQEQIRGYANVMSVLAQTRDRLLAQGDVLGAAAQQAEYDRFADMVRQATGDLQRFYAVRDGAAGGGAASDKAKEAIADLQKELVLTGAVTELQKVRANITLGTYGAINDAQKVELESLAKQIDQRNAALDVQKEAVKIEEKLAETRKELAEVTSTYQYMLGGATEAEAKFKAEYERADPVTQQIMERERAIKQMTEARERDTEAAQKAAEQLQRANERAAEGIEEAFFSAWRGALDGWEGMKERVIDGAKDLFARLMVILTRNNITIPIVMSVGGMLGLSPDSLGGITSALGGGQGNLLGSILGSGGSSAFGGLDALSNGLLTSLENGLYALGDTFGIESATAFGDYLVANGNAIIGNMSAAIGGAAGVAGLFMAGRALATPGSRISADAQGIGAVLAPGVSLMLSGIDRALGGNLFGTRWRVTGQQLAINIEDAIADATLTTFRSRKRSFGRGTKRSSTVDDALELDGQINDAFGVVYTSIAAGVESLGLRMASFSFSANLDLKGKTEEEITELLNGAITDATERLLRTAIPGIERFQQAGEDLGQTFERLVTGAAVVRNAIDLLGLDTNVRRSQNDAASGIRRFPLVYGRTAEELRASYEAANPVVEANAQLILEVTDSLVRMAGGVEQLQNNVTSFYDAFASDQIKNINNTASVADLFGGLNVAIPGTKAELYQLVSGLDIFSESGREALVAITAATPLLKDYFNVIDQRTKMIDGVQQSLAQMDMSDLQIQLDNISRARAEQIETAIGLGASERELDLIRRYAARQSANVIEAEAQRMQSVFQQLADQIAGVRSSIQADIQRIASAQPGFDAVGSASTRVTDLRGRVGQGTTAEQIETVNQLRQAIVDRYNAEVSAAQAAAQEQNAARQAQVQAAQAARQAADQQLEAARRLLDYVQRLGLSSESPLTAFERFAEAQQNYQRAIQGNDYEAMQRAADDYLRENRAVYGVSDQAVQIFESVRSQLTGRAASAADEARSQIVRAPALEAAVSQVSVDISSVGQAALDELAGLDEILAQLLASEEGKVAEDIAEMRRQYDQAEAHHTANLSVWDIQANAQAARDSAHLAQLEQMNATLREQNARLEQRDAANTAALANQATRHDQQIAQFGRRIDELGTRLEKAVGSRMRA